MDLFFQFLELHGIKCILFVYLLLVYVRKLSDEERPLRLRLCSGPSEKVLSFVIKENETGEVNVSLIIFYILYPMNYMQWQI